MTKTRIGPDLREIPIEDEDHEDDVFWDDDDLDCTMCGGDGVEDNDDPLWYGFDKDWIPCRACGGTGDRKHQTIF